MAGPESRLRTRIVKALNDYSGFWYVNHQTQYGQTGIPDITGIYQGYYFGLEVKRPGYEYTLTERQSRVLKKIRLAGGKAAVVTSVDDAMSFVFGSAP